MIRASHLDLTRHSIISIISDAKSMATNNGVSSPYTIHLSPAANRDLLDELEEKDGKKHSMVFEVCGMKVEIDPNCPPSGAYITGK